MSEVLAPREVQPNIWHHDDAQDNRVAIALSDIALGPIVVFDGGGFMDPVALRAFISDLLLAAARLDERVVAGQGDVEGSGGTR